MKKIKRNKFQPYKWLIFEIDNITCVGYTFYEGSNEMVLYVSENLESKIMSFSEINCPRVLSISNQAKIKIAQIANVSPEQVALWVKANA